MPDHSTLARGANRGGEHPGTILLMFFFLISGALFLKIFGVPLSMVRTSLAAPRR